MHRLLILFAALCLGAPLARAGDEPPAEPSPLEKIHEGAKKALRDLGIEFYGHFKLDSSRDTSETNFGDTAFYVKNYGPGGKDEEINITARHTRLGLNWTGGEDRGISATGNIEMDFLGKAVQKNSETQELQSAVRLRHAWMKFDFGGGWSLLAGQTWDVFAPLNMKKLNTMVGWGQGNMGFRRPQIRVSKRLAVDEETDLTVDFAIARPVARDSTKLDDDSQDDGEDSGVPDLQAHAGLKIPFLGEKPLKAGVGGVIGWREIGGGGTHLKNDVHYKTWAACLDAVVPVLGNLDLLGELWTGKALDGYRAGVWQSFVVHEHEVHTIRAWGGFANLVWKPVKDWMVVAGYGVDNPEDASFHGEDGRYENRTLFGNVRYRFYKNATVGIELDRMETDYRDDRNRVNYRVQVSFILKF